MAGLNKLFLIKKIILLIYKIFEINLENILWKI